ncbi:MAG: hypothetical protein ACLQLH_07505 [Terracidiphilus sp.]
MIVLRSDRPLILAILLLAAGLGLIYAYGTGTANFDAAYPVDHALLQLSIATHGVAAIGGLVLTAMGILALVFALIYAIIGQIQLIGWSEKVMVPLERERERGTVFGLSERERAIEREEEWLHKA